MANGPAAATNAIRAWLIGAFALSLTLSRSSFVAKAQEGPTQQASGASDTAQMAARIGSTAADWLNGRLSTPGTSGELREMERSTQNGEVAVRYNIAVNGAPRDQTYALLSWPINAPGPLVQMSGLSVDPSGLVICAGRTPDQCAGEKENDPVDLVFSPAKGEVFRLALLSQDGKTKIFFAAIPEPIIKREHSCALEVIRLTAKFELILVRGKGYRPNEDLLLSSRSYDESHATPAKADNDGAYVVALAPFVEGKQSGKTTLSLRGAQCAPVISFEWGR